jgi:predicted nicotinamide N-methyase
VDLPGTDVRLTVRRPKDFDRLLEMAAPDPEQNLPYWAELWPSGIALAAKITLDPEALRGQRVLELGSGLGVTAIAALRAGAALLVTDYAQEALNLCALNTLDQAGSEPEALRLNWRDPSAQFFELVGEGFPIVLAADVLYERRDVEPLLGLVDRIVLGSLAGSGGQCQRRCGDDPRVTETFRLNIIVAKRCETSAASGCKLRRWFGGSFERWGRFAGGVVPKRYESSGSPCKSSSTIAEWEASGWKAFASIVLRRVLCGVISHVVPRCGTACLELRQ